MQDFDKTTFFAEKTEQTTGSLVTIFDGVGTPRTIDLSAFGKSFVYFGRGEQNDIILTSHLVSAEHGRFVFKDGCWTIEDKAAYQNRASTNGLIYNNSSVISRNIADGDFIRIDDGIETVSEGVLFVFSSVNSENKWQSLQLNNKSN